MENQYLIKFPFDGQPGDYQVWLTLSYDGREYKAVRRVSLIPPETSLIVTAQPWYRDDRAWILVLSAGLAAAIVVYLLARMLRGQRRLMTQQKHAAKEIGERYRSDKCWLELPDNLTVPPEFLRATAQCDMSEDEAKTIVKTDSPDAFLLVECLNHPVPLLYGRAGIVENLVVGRHTERAEKLMEKGTVYLWVSELYHVVSRPHADKPGHCRIFVSAGERYAVEDLYSVNGTLLNDREIKAEGSFPLQDGDVIEVGGKQGIRIVYKEGRLQAGDGDEMERTLVLP